MILAILGPTGVGKTKMSIELAKKYNAIIINCDAMQVYKDLNIGTAKVTEEEKEGIKHFLFDIRDVNEEYSVFDYQKDARHIIEENKDKNIIFVGGTGLYVDSLIYGIEYQEIEFDDKYRQELEKKVETEGLEKLYEEAKKIDYQAMEKISPKDKKRIMRVLEIYKSTGKTKTEQEVESRKNGVKYDFKVFAINMDREKLYERINKRVDIMIEQGLIKEVENLLTHYSEFPTAMQGLGYKEVVEYLQGEITKEEMIEKIKMETRRYAKRQITWFKKNKQTVWIGAKDLQKILDEI